MNDILFLHVWGATGWISYFRTPSRNVEGMLESRTGHVWMASAQIGKIKTAQTARRRTPLLSSTLIGKLYFSANFWWACPAQDAHLEPALCAHFIGSPKYEAFVAFVQNLLVLIFYPSLSPFLLLPCLLGDCTSTSCEITKRWSFEYRLCCFCATVCRLPSPHWIAPMQALFAFIVPCAVPFQCKVWRRVCVWDCTLRCIRTITLLSTAWTPPDFFGFFLVNDKCLYSSGTTVFLHRKSM